MIKKHNHNISLYQKLRNDGMSWSQIANHLNIPQTSIITWVKTNYNEVTLYNYINKKNN